MLISMTATTQGFKKRCIVRDTKGNKGPSRSKNGGHAVRYMAAHIVFTVSVFGNCNSMCKYRVSTCNEPAYTCVRAYRPHEVHVTSIGWDRFSCPFLYISTTLCARFKPATPIRYPTSTCCNYLQLSNFAKSACTSH